MQPEWVKRLDTITKYSGILVICLSLVYFPPLAWKGWREAHYPKQSVTQPFKTEQEAREFRRLLKKHGLQYNISVVYTRYNGKQYFVRGQREYEFK